MFSAIFQIILQMFFGDIYAKISSLKKDNKRLYQKLRKIKKKKAKSSDERKKRMNREMSHSIFKASKDIGNTYHKMQDIKEQARRTNLQVLCETGLHVINKVASENN